MDTELARTFLAILETGNFQRAADQLNITQSTVSMRVKTLEAMLGRPLFVRSKSGTRPSAAGILFGPYAARLVRTWTQACQEVALPAGFQALLAVGGQFTLWERLLLKWIPWMRAAVPTVAIRAEVGLPDGLMRGLVEGLLDIGVMFTPQSRPGLAIEVLLEERLILVSTDAEAEAPGGTGYVYVDWGPEFHADYSKAYPELETPSLYVSHGPLALQHILDNGGAGYFPLRLVRRALAEERLHAVAGAMEFLRPVYLVYQTDRSDEWFRTALQGLRYVAALEDED